MHDSPIEQSGIERLYQIAAVPFEAARSITSLAPGHRARRIHGHSFLARAALLAGGEPVALASELIRCVECLDYRLLNELLVLPTDENLVHWLRERLGVAVRVGIQSTRNQGADLDLQSCVHFWRRFRFEAAHRLPQVASTHPCGRMHGHGFDVILYATQCPSGGSTGTEVFDPDLLISAWQPLQETLHGSCLNDLPGLDNPTSEVLAYWIWHHLKPHLPWLSQVVIYETASAACQYDGATYRIWKTLYFESALHLARGGSGHSHRIHGHSYLLRLHLLAPLDTVMGWTVDYGNVKEQFRPIYAQLDHHLLNDLPGLFDAELGEVARWIRAQTHPLLPQLNRIDLYETPNCGAVLAWGEGDPTLVFHP
ncbi:6-pyruvoyltetrahydropterin/6-carboxytetrahydropterin synthase [Gammaproteobacteria bacterium]